VDFADFTGQIYKISAFLKLWTSCLKRIFGTLSKIFYISIANPKIFRLDLEFIIFEKPASDN
jgi:hypothetical protein